MASSRSRPLPCGTPSIMSMRTTSPSSFEAIQCAAVAPTFPEPTIVTFLRIEILSERELFTNRCQFSDQPVRARGNGRTSKYADSWRLITDSFSCRAECPGCHVFDDVASE